MYFNLGMVVHCFHVRFVSVLSLEKCEISDLGLGVASEGLGGRARVGGRVMVFAPRFSQQSDYCHWLRSRLCPQQTCNERASCIPWSYTLSYLWSLTYHRSSPEIVFQYYGQDIYGGFHLFLSGIGEADTIMTGDIRIDWRMTLLAVEDLAWKNE